MKPISPYIQSRLKRAGWSTVDSMPKKTWCRTMRIGEKGDNLSMWVDAGPVEGREYWDPQGYSTVVNPGTFAEPTHWKEVTVQDLVKLLSCGAVRVHAAPPKPMPTKPVSKEAIAQVVYVWAQEGESGSPALEVLINRLVKLQG